MIVRFRPRCVLSTMSRMRGRRMAAWLCLALFGFGGAVGAEPVVRSGPVAGSVAGSVDGADVVLDLRSEEACLRGSRPAVRCLPATSLLRGAAGTPVSFHALRWLLGTVGLTGRENVALYGASATDAWAVAGLLHLAGQARITVLADAPADPDHPGTPRAMSREAVYTAPMRDHLMTVTAGAQPGRDALAAVARTGAPVAFAPIVTDEDEKG